MELAPLPIDGSSRGPSAARAPSEAAVKAKARHVAEDFEATFLATVLNSMFAGIDTKGLFGGGHGEEVYRSMFVDEVSKSISARGGVGIADSVYREIVRMQGLKP